MNTPHPSPIPPLIPPGWTDRASSSRSSLEETPEDDVAPRSVPAWLMSLIIHLVILLGLVLIPYQQGLLSGVSMTGSFGGTEGDASFELDGTSDDASTIDMAQESQMDAISQAVAAMEIAPAESLTPVAVGGGVEGIESSITMGLSGRSGGMKDALLKAYGGTKGTEDSVKLGLKWLVKQQLPDGSWSLMRPYTSGAKVDNPVAATAMAMLALLGAGNTHLQGEYRENVKNGLYYLRGLQDKNGFFARDIPSNQRSYSQAQCTIAICELYAMSKDPSLKELADDAITYALYSQSPEGGWRYQPKTDSDVSVTGWFVMALMSARMAGLSVPPGPLQKVGEFLDSVQYEDGALYGYSTLERGPRLSMTAEGLLCRQYLGWKPYEVPMRNGAEALLENPITVTGDQGPRAYYYWYYATQVLHHMGGEHWTKWNASMREALPAMQIREGKEAGSWAPQGEQWGAYAGRLYSTCLSLYCLEVYYRHMPLYEMKK